MSKQENRKDSTAREESFGALGQAMPQSGGDMGDTMAFTPLGKQAEKQQPAQAAGIGHGRTGNYGQETACQSRYQAEDTHQNEKDV